MSHTHEMFDTDQYFSIDAESKEITFQGDAIPTLVQGDHDSEIYTFELPRFIDGHDMLNCDIAQVHFVNMNAANNAERSMDIYNIRDLQIDEENPSFLLFSWLVSGKATAYVGPLTFALRFACTTNTKIDYDWYTRPYTKLGVSSTQNNNDTFAEYYSDIIKQWYYDLVFAGDAGVNVVVDAKNKAIEDIGTAANEAIERIAAVETIREIEAETLASFEQAKNSALEAIRTAEAEAIANERKEIVAEIITRILYTGSVTYPNAEEASF